MNKDKLIETMGDIDPEFVREARPKSKKRLAFRIGALTLALLIVIGAAIATPRLWKASPGVSAGLPTAKPGAENDYLLYAPSELSFVSAPQGLEEDMAVYRAWHAAVDARRQAGEGIASMSGFASKLTSKLLSEGKNLVWSPSCVYLALAMLAEVSDGNTRAQILDVLGADDMQVLRAGVTALLEADNYDDGCVTSLFADSIWLRNDVVFNSDALERLAEIYRASSYWGDTTDEGFSEALRNWLKENTGGLLDDSADNIELDPETVLAICSAVYFRGGWDVEFAKDRTDKGMFHGANGDIETDFMHKDMDSGVYSEWDGFVSFAEKIGQDGNRMIWLLPDDGVSVEEMLSRMDIDEVANAAAGENMIVHFSAPKLDVSSVLDLIPALSALGMTDCLDPSVSDFTPLTDHGPLNVTKIAHSARVKTDEEGVEAAAFTVVFVNDSAALLSREVELTLDRPFAFIITGVTGAPIFIGIVNDPANR